MSNPTGDCLAAARRRAPPVDDRLGDRPGPDGAPLAHRRQLLRCGACSALLEAALPSDCDVDVAVAAMLAVRCGACGSSRLLLGQSRTLAEDRARRRASSYPDRVAEWARDGEHGSAAVVVYRAMTGQPQGRPSVPLDAADALRCLLLLDRVPEWRPRMAEMAALSPAWASLAPRWAVLEEALAADGVGSGRGGPCPETRAVLLSTAASAG